LTTVHFGGGTPSHLGAAAFARIVSHLRTRLTVRPDTEWAIESTVRSMTDEYLDQLLGLGFKRLHAGVQTLEPEVRQLIRRQETSEVVLERLSHAVNRGFLVSVDLVYGFPTQTLAGFIATIHRLIKTGILGFSLYQLQSGSRNQGFLNRHRSGMPDLLTNYLLFQSADQHLTRNGYLKNHFAHFARSEDRNLYYTHRQRGEDLLALGPTADGLFGSYHYRHPELPEYLEGKLFQPVLEGGLRENLQEQKLRPAVTSLMGGGITTAILKEIGADILLQDWLNCEMIHEEQPGRFTLKANGSWFLSQMIEQLSWAVAN